MTPNYTKIYQDLIKYKNKEEFVSEGLAEKINNIKIVKDILEIEKQLFRNDNLQYNQKLKSYDEVTIKELLNDQKKNMMTNAQLGIKYNISRNTIAKWKKVYNI